MPRSRPTAFARATPSRRATARSFPEEWRWWRASGWQIVIEDTAEGGLHLFSQREGTSWGGSITKEEAATREGIRQFLTEALYYHLHPRKAARAVGAFGMVATDKELAAFIRQQRRKLAKLAAA